MEWKDIRSLLEHAVSKVRSHSLLKKTVTDAVESTLNLSLNGAELQIKNGVAYFPTLHAAIRTEMMLQKDKILAVVHKAPAGAAIRDIR